MAGWQPRAGDTLLMPSGSQGSHLFVLLNDPKTFPGYGSREHVVLVNLSTVQAHTPYDTTCVLQPGSHAFVKQTSFVYYRGVRIEPVDHLVKLVQQGYFQPHDPMPAAEFATILAGLVASPFTKREFKQLRV